MFFADAEPETIAAAIRRFAAERAPDPVDCHANALRFSTERFRQHLIGHIDTVIDGVRANGLFDDRPGPVFADPARPGRDRVAAAGARPPGLARAG